MAYDTIPSPIIRAAVMGQKREPTIVEVKEGTQLKSMMSSIPRQKGVSDVNAWLQNITTNAVNQGISVAVTTYKPFGEDKPHAYLLLSPYRATIETMKNENFKDLPEWIEHSKSNGRGTVLLDRVAIDITGINRHNYFQMNSMIMRQIQDMSIVKQAFLNEGYSLPDFVNSHTVHSIWELDHMRANDTVPANLRERYNETYKKAVADYAQMYCEKYKDVISDISHKGRHKVPESYFKENHVPCTWEVVNGEFYKFIETELKKGRFPEFIYYKPDNAFLKTKNLSKMFEKLGLSGETNFWAKDTGTKKYYICMPATQEHIFYTLMNEYNTRKMEHKKTVPQIQAMNTPDTPTQLIYVPVDDIYNWDRLCTANNVSWAIDDGTVLQRQITDRDAAEAIPVIYPFKDISMVNAIVARLSQEIRDYVPISDRTSFESRQRSAKNVAERVMAQEQKEIEQTRRNPGMNR